MPNEPVSWSIIRKKYGPEVVRYLKQHNVQPAKTDFGVYKISNVSTLKECSKIATTLRDKLAKEPPKKKRQIENSQDSTIEYTCYNVPDQVKRIVNIDPQKYRPRKDVSQLRMTNLPVEVNLLVSLDPLLFRRLNKMPLLSFTLSKKISTSWDYDQLFHSMMRTYIGCQKPINYDACLTKIKPILRTFERKHREFRFSTLLESIMTRKNSSDGNVPQVSIRQLQQFFFTVSVKVIPRELFGNNANIKKLRMALRKYFLSSWGEIVTLKSIVMSMDISCITWLKVIPDVETKWLIIAKLSRWLFEVYIVAILKKIFRVQKDLYSEKRNILSASRWKKLKDRCLKTQEKKQTLVKKSLVPNLSANDFAPSGTTKLYAKKNGVRCIYRFRLQKWIRDEVTMLKILLQQLYRLKYDSVTIRKLYPSWLRFAKAKRENSDHPFYLVSSDIVDAYGSVSQTKLYDILHGMISEIPGDNIPLEWLAILKPSNSWRKNSVEFSQWFSCCASLPRIPAHSLVTLAQDKDHRPQFISKMRICTTLRVLISQQTVWYEGTEYLLKRGLAQGFPLSAILSEIYYAHMTNEEFGIFKKTGMLSRYVDDFLYITDKKQVAKQFMNKIRKGVPEYCCRFKMSKTQTNLKSRRWKSTVDVEYLGHRINTATLEVSPVYGNLEFRHLKSMQCIKYKNEIQTFVMRLENFAALKLSSIVLDTTINSVEVILGTADSAAYTMASRCVVLIPKVYQKCEPYSSEIWEGIRNAIKILTKTFTTHLSRYKKEQRSTLIRYIKMTIWKAVYRAFAKKTNLRRCFGESIRRMIKNRWAF